MRELCLTGEDFYAPEAEKIGFVSRVYQNDDVLMAMAKKLCLNISKNSPVASSLTKSSLNYSR